MWLNHCGAPRQIVIVNIIVNVNKQQKLSYVKERGY